jgi:hypothetical protein
MAAYLRWLAPRYDGIRRGLRQEIIDGRRAAASPLT